METNNPSQSAISRIWNNFLTSNIPVGDNPFKRKYYVIKFINLISIVIVIGTFFLLVFDFYTYPGISVPAIFHSVSMVLVLIMIFVSRKTKNTDLASTFCVLILYAESGFLMYVDPFGDNVLAAIYTMPFVQFFLKGAKKGFYWTMGFFIYMVGILVIFRQELITPFLQDNRWVYIAIMAPTNLGTLFLFQYINERYAKVAEGNKEELIEALDTVEKEKLQIETTLRSIADGVFATDHQGNIVLMNVIAEKLSGYDYTTSRNRHYSEIIKLQKEDETTSPYLLLIDEVLKEGQMKSLLNNIVLTRKDGLKIPVAISAAPIKDTKGVIIGCVTALHDTTEERELMQSKTAFVSVAAKKLRAPLGQIQEKIETVLKGVPNETPPSVKDSVSDVQQITRRVVDLVDELLTVLQIDQRRIQNNLEPTNILDIIYEAVIQMADKTNKKSIAITVHDNTNNLPAIMVDQAHFHDVMIKLLNNAVDYNEENGTVSILLEQKDNSLRIHIVDTGVGIPEKDHHKVFNKFYRSEYGLLHYPEGSGLGLFIAKAFIQSFGGALHFRSPLFFKTLQDGTQVGRGTDLLIELPIHSTVV